MVVTRRKKSVSFVPSEHLFFLQLSTQSSLSANARCWDVKGIFAGRGYLALFSFENIGVAAGDIGYLIVAVNVEQLSIHQDIIICCMRKFGSTHPDFEGNV